VPNLLIVGGGKMGSALLGGLLRCGWAEASDVVVVEPEAERRGELAEAFPGVRTLPAPAAGLLQDGGERIAGAVLAVKPDVAEGACRALGVTGVTRLLSIVAGVPSVRLEAALGGEPAVVRAMPNTPALVGAGVTAISGGSFATSQDLAWAEDVLSAVGTVVRLPERLQDAVTGLSGSGPAYFFLVAEALMEAGVQMGLTREMSRTLVVETMRGSAALLRETGRDPEALRAMVTSPAGTTAAGIRTLEARAVRSAFMEAVAAATERSRNLQR
jgi:pyrroline-5-carboxylate reductase